MIRQQILSIHWRELYIMLAKIRSRKSLPTMTITMMMMNKINKKSINNKCKNTLIKKSFKML